MSKLERLLIWEYRGKSDRQQRNGVIRGYAQLMNMSEGRAEDALDLWVYLLGAARRYSGNEATMGIQ